MDIKILILVVAALNFALGFFVWQKNKKNKVNISFAILALSFSIWSLFFYFYFNPIFLSRVTWIKLVYLMVFIMIYSFFYFVCFFLIKRSSLFKILTIIFSLFTIPLIWVLFFTELWVKNVILKSWGPEMVLGPAFVPFQIFATFFFIVVLVILIKNYFSVKGIAKLQFKYILLGIFSYGILITLTDVIVPLILKTSRLFWMGPFFTLLFIGFSTYAITRYRLMDIRLVIKRGTAHLITGILILSVYTALILFGQQILVEDHNWSLTWTTAIAVLIIAISVEPLRRLVIKIVNSLIYTKKEKKRFLDKETAKLHAQKLMATQKAAGHVDDLVTAIINDYLYFISLDEIKLLLYSNDTKKLECSYPRDKKLSLEINSALFNFLNNNAEILVTQEIPYLLEDGTIKNKELLKEALKLLKKNQILIAVPVGAVDNVQGIFLFGKKADGEIYTKDDIDTIKEFRAAYTPVLINTIMYKEAVDRIKV